MILVQAKSQEPRAKRNCVQRTPIFIPMPIASASISSLVVYQHPVATTDNEPIEDVDTVALDVDLVTLDVDLSSPRCSHGYTLKEVEEGALALNFR